MLAPVISDSFLRASRAHQAWALKLNDLAEEERRLSRSAAENRALEYRLKRARELAAYWRERRKSLALQSLESHIARLEKMAEEERKI